VASPLLEAAVVRESVGAFATGEAAEDAWDSEVGIALGLVEVELAATA
jgi:hypothetical protein